MPRKIKKFTEPEPINDGGLDIYKEVWTFMYRGSTEINKIYLKKEDAEKACDMINKEIYNHSRQSNKNMSDKEFHDYYNDRNSYHAKYSVWTLADAIELIKEEIYDNASDPGESY